MSSSATATGTHDDFGDWHWAHNSRCECTELEHSQWQPPLAFLDSTGFPLDSLSCVVVAPQILSRQSIPFRSLRSDPEIWVWAPNPTLCGCRIASCFCTGNCCLAIIPVVNFLFCLWSTCFCIPLWGSKVPHCSQMWKGFWVCENLSSFLTPSQGAGPHPEIHCLFFHLYLCPIKYVLFIIWDWNAKVGSQETHGVTGKFGLGVWNEVGQWLIEFCQENTLVIAKTVFQQCKKRLYTWTTPDGRHQN